MCIEYNECHYGGMYNINVKRIFVIIEIVQMNAGVSSEKENVKEYQLHRVTPPLDTHFGCRVLGRHRSNIMVTCMVSHTMPHMVPSVFSLGNCCCR